MARVENNNCLHIQAKELLALANNMMHGWQIGNHLTANRGSQTHSPLTLFLQLAVF
jgi:hypothetical protein